MVDTLEHYVDNKLRMGFDGAVLVEVLASFGFPPEKNPSLIQRLRRNEVSAGGQLGPAAIIRPERPRCRDFFQSCEEGNLFEVRLYLHAGMSAEASEEVVGGTRRTGLMIAASKGHAKVGERGPGGGGGAVWR